MAQIDFFDSENLINQMNERTHSYNRNSIPDLNLLKEGINNNIL